MPEIPQTTAPSAWRPRLLVLALLCGLLLLGLWLVSHFGPGERLLADPALVPELSDERPPAVAAASGIDPEVLTIRVVGRRYGWQIRYPGADGRLDTRDDVVRSSLRLPAAERARLEVTSEDYLYSFKIRQLGVNEVAVPDMIMAAELDTGPEATAELRGDQFCGFNHHDLNGEVKVVSRREFERWLASDAAEPG